MGNPITVEPKVWEDIHRAYVAEHIGKAIDICDDIANSLALYAMTGQSVYWKDAFSLINHLAERAHGGSLNRVRAIAYFVCEACDSDICEHADQYN